MMLRSLFTVCESYRRVLSPLQVNIQTVRSRMRKPRHLPRAKSKMFHVPPRMRLPEDEKLEVMRLYNNYRTYVRSLRCFFKEELDKTAADSDVAIELKKQDDQFHAQCLLENETWNADVAKLRAVRLAQQEKLQSEEVMNKLISHEAKEREKLLKAENLVRKVKEQSKSYITLENIDKAIDDALSREVDFNFSIDVNGNIFQGRLTKPTIEK